jgi:hypothetical protein
VEERKMGEDVFINSIPLDVAIQICSEIRKESHLNWDSPTARWCWSCQRLSEGDPQKIAYIKKPGNRGCHLVNVRYVQLKQDNPNIIAR